MRPIVVITLAATFLAWSASTLAGKRIGIFKLSLCRYSTGQEGTTQLALSEGLDHYKPVLEYFRTADHPAHWRIITDDHEIRWPAGFTLDSFQSWDQSGIAY